MINIEKGYQHVRVGKFKFSPAVKSNLDWCYVLKWLLRPRCKIQQEQKTKTNIANRKWFDRRNIIDDPLTFSTNALLEMYKLEKQRTRCVLADSAWMRTKYLNAKLQVATNAEKDEDVARLEMLIKNERQKKIWRRIRYVISHHRLGGVTKERIS